MRLVPVLAVALILALVLASGAMAASTVVQQQTFTGTPNCYPDFVFSKFDTNLGVLTSVKITMQLTTAGGLLVLDNDSASPASGNFEFGAKGDISSTDVILLDSSYAHVTPTVSTLTTGSFSLAGDPSPVSGDYNPAGPDGGSFAGANASQSAFGFIDSSFWGGYQGAGTYTIHGAVTQWSDYGSVGGIEYAVTPVNADGYVEVVYTYDAVPEPGSMMGLMTGLGAFGFLVRRRK